jgi:hypothetical protein
MRPTLARRCRARRRGDRRRCRAAPGRGRGRPQAAWPEVDLRPGLGVQEVGRGSPARALRPALGQPMQVAEGVGDTTPVGLRLGRSVLHVGLHHQTVGEQPMPRPIGSPAPVAPVHITQGMSRLIATPRPPGRPRVLPCAAGVARRLVYVSGMAASRVDIPHKRTYNHIYTDKTGSEQTCTQKSATS